MKYAKKTIEVDGQHLGCHLPVLLYRDGEDTVVVVRHWADEESAAAGEPHVAESKYRTAIPVDTDDVVSALVGDFSVSLAGAEVVSIQQPWVDLAPFKERAWERIKAERSAREYSGFEWDGSRFDSDAESQRRIQGAAQLAMLAQAAGQPFSIDWTLADNSVRTLSGADMIAVGTAMGVHVATVHTIGRQLRAAINAAQTPEEIETVEWPL